MLARIPIRQGDPLPPHAKKMRTLRLTWRIAGQLHAIRCQAVALQRIFLKLVRQETPPSASVLSDRTAAVGLSVVQTTERAP
jgi:hypothetical protein